MNLPPIGYSIFNLFYSSFKKDHENFDLDLLSMDCYSLCHSDEKILGLYFLGRIGIDLPIVACYVEEIKKELSLLKQESLQVIDLPPAEKEKFLKIAYDGGWKDILEKCPKTGPKLRALLTKKK